jgi:HAD superfamily hydrolase (TIGR01549 family)
MAMELKDCESRLASIRVITFDLDDTLWPIQPVIRRAEGIFFAWLQENMPAITYRYTQESLLNSRTRFMQAAPATERHNLSLLRKKWLREVARETGADSERLETEGFAVFWQARNEVNPFPGAEEMLMRLASRFVLGAVSNGTADIFRTPLGSYFTFSMPAAEAGAAKPERRIFDHAVRKAGVDHSAVLHIGDDPVCDVAGALRAGLQAAWFNPSGHRWENGHDAPEWIFSSMEEIPEILGL